MPDTLLDAGPLVTTEPIVAWRAWTLGWRRHGERVDLLPIAGSSRPWPTMRPAEASCTRPKLHRAPFPNCTCGLHATFTPDLLRRTRDPVVVGTAALWGRVIEHDHGYRAEFAYPQRLRLVCLLCFVRWGLLRTGPDQVVRLRGGHLTPLCWEHLEIGARYGFPTKRRMPADEVEGALLSAYAVDLLRA